MVRQLVSINRVYRWQMLCVLLVNGSITILFNTGPRFNGKALSEPAYVTVLHNGVLVQNHVEIQGKTEWIGAPSYKAHECAPLQLQDHGNQVSFRNVWVRELKTNNE